MKDSQVMINLKSIINKIVDRQKDLIKLWKSLSIAVIEVIFI